jgi:hypothetical protein
MGGDSAITLYCQQQVITEHTILCAGMNRYIAKNENCAYVFLFHLVKSQNNTTQSNQVISGYVIICQNQFTHSQKPIHQS